MMKELAGLVAVSKIQQTLVILVICFHVWCKKEKVRPDAIKSISEKKNISSSDQFASHLKLL